MIPSLLHIYYKFKGTKTEEQLLQQPTQINDTFKIFIEKQLIIEKEKIIKKLSNACKQLNTKKELISAYIKTLEPIKLLHKYLQSIKEQFPENNKKNTSTTKSSTKNYPTYLEKALFLKSISIEEFNKTIPQVFQQIFINLFEEMEMFSDHIYEQIFQHRFALNAQVGGRLQRLSEELLQENF
ncbi:MAG: hypothetical protein GXP45_03890 [bacterium]|nr:hypothetical protein [bacterium]